ncbi:uncharacterized protein EHS24_009101 [Apiotrichum porosum]|uniref:Galactose oxidase-like Early set domain-containing protein n=1 Tax=Apiotrichum porosum TaxID=105984 RepID=A0A427XNM9_9TREE|nr:uncharacterized protein EHS24_009101 [Apiotrichum porosum]RSH80521.1 hypothetical protein EHS24_009101 [Apiotrichum porosum]
MIPQATWIHVVALTLAAQGARAQLANTMVQINGHPAWASEVDLTTWEARAMDVTSNSFCAGGTVLGNGTWLNVGGNQAVIANGDSAGAAGSAAQSGDNVYGDADGRKAVRILDPDNNGQSEWVDNSVNYMTTERWYPTLETLEDGTAIIFGGCQNGGYVNDASQDNPTYEYFPPKANWELVTLNILKDTLPLNLFPLVWLLPSGNILIQAYMQAVIFDYKNNVEYPIANIPDCARVYPASAATTMLAMTPANNWTASVIFCGGSNYGDSINWAAQQQLPTYAASTSCVSINPDVDANWYTEDALDAGRSMGQFINLPDRRLLFVNGAGTGTAGYGTDTWAVGHSYADNPQYQSYYLDKSKPAGQRWSKAATSKIARMYHSSAVLLPDGSVAVAGSNPNPDYIPNNGTYTYFTDSSIEIFYPDYYDKSRPKPSGMPSTITYGGDYFNVTLTKADLGGKTLNINNTNAVIIRTGFSTHSMNMGQRHVELMTSFTTTDDGGAVLHVAQMPPNPAILVPGPALFFIVVDGVPSNASWITVGDGVVGTQTLLPASALPDSSITEDQANGN